MGELTNYGKSVSLPQGLMTVSEVALILHVHPNTVRLWSDIGLLKACRIGRRRDRRFRHGDIEEFLSSNGENTA